MTTFHIVGSCFPPLSIACYDIYDNWIPFAFVTGVIVKLDTSKSVNIHVDKFKIDVSADKLTLNIEDILIESYELDKIQPHYEATLVIFASRTFIPRSLKYVTIQSPNFGNNLLPGSMVKQLKFEMFDTCSNHINKGLEVELNLDGFRFEDQLGIKRKVDDYGCVDLSGLLKVTGGYGKSDVAIVNCINGFSHFQSRVSNSEKGTEILSGVPECCPVGSQLENIVFEVVDCNGDADASIHDNEESGQSHTHDKCEGCFCFVAVHSRYIELRLGIKVPLLQSPKRESSEIPSYSDGKLQLLEGSTPLKHVGNLAVSIIKTEKELESEICKYGLRMKNHEMALKIVNDQTTEVEQVLSQLQALTEPHILTDPSSSLTKEEITRQIESGGQSAAAVLCCVAEYLGEDQMLVLVCRSFRAACALEEYEQNGEVNCTLGLHGKATERGNSIVGRFLVICLEDMRCYIQYLTGAGVVTGAGLGEEKGFREERVDLKEVNGILSSSATS
ncbi:hypothetical protein Pint_25582 [Pistacia integerrima]|uniref:Uncharacterized protein n=1 Tax=Pistacia integerrima TaxID=434235 RepID=A0ACC0YI10_9ROSI|nr:hypothetical protein Pint_25582 [Pistacia integerrima]